ncbi:MAG: hypothetical protein HOK97_20045 [Deltaproteobacteria bacterium]|nr:hypothetical protein [Deltaproteobacteria bacterium]MBT6492074.1 hypothetical protein [Deltaproteobacteria bacterium]
MNELSKKTADVPEMTEEIGNIEKIRLNIVSTSDLCKNLPVRGEPWNGGSLVPGLIEQVLAC